MGEAAKVVKKVRDVTELLPHRERLMLASHRAKKRVSALKYMRLRSDVAMWQHLGNI